MGAWDTGPFDNDIAADWGGELDDAPADERVQLIRDALAAAADETEYLDGSFACEAIAAAAVVASQRPGGADLVRTAYAPDFLEAGGSIELPPDLADLAVRALDRVVAPESEWLEEWQEAGEDDAVVRVGALRARLAG